jgi:hypothetical protein
MRTLTHTPPHPGGAPKEVCMIHPYKAEDPRALVAAEPVSADVAEAQPFGPHHRGNAVFRLLMRDTIAGVAPADARSRRDEIARLAADLASARRWRDQAFTAWKQSRHAVDRVIG